jgi:YfiH family protein
MIESKLIPNAFFSDKSVKSVNNLKDNVGIRFIASMNQTHSDVVTFVKSPRVYDSDGIYTEKPKLGLVVQTADCMPILLIDKKRIGAIHSGWRGLKNNIVEKAIKKFDVNQLSISIGPHAQSCCYEIKEDVKKYFNDYTEVRDDMFFLNMSQVLKDLSEEQGFQLEISSICTICNSSYNSYRENKTSKRQFGVIWK